MTKKVEIGGVPVTVVSDDEAEKSDYLVCMPWGHTPFQDNFKGVCCHCGREVMYRWHAPRKPKRICFECMLKLEQKKLTQSQTTQDEL